MIITVTLVWRTAIGLIINAVEQLFRKQYPILERLPNRILRNLTEDLIKRQARAIVYTTLQSANKDPMVFQ